MDIKNSPDSAASRRTQPELQGGEQAGDKVGRQIAPEKLQSIAMTSATQADAAPENTTQAFKLIAANIDKFVDNEWIDSGLRKEDPEQNHQGRSPRRRHRTRPSCKILERPL